MEGTTSPDEFYVYDLIDPRCGSTFYVGKGRGNRNLQHLSEANRGKPGDKCDRIRAILRDGHEYTSRIIARYSDEQAAIDAEADRIEYFGLENLTNIMPRGWVFIPGLGHRRKSKPLTAADYQRLVDKNALRIVAAEGLIEAGCRFMMGNFDVSEVIRTAFRSLREKAGAEYFDQRLAAA